MGVGERRVGGLGWVTTTGALQGDTSLANERSLASNALPLGVGWDKSWERFEFFSRTIFGITSSLPLFFSFDHMQHLHVITHSKHTQLQTSPRMQPPI